MEFIIIDYLSLQAEIKKQLALKKWKYEHLAKATGYELETIYQFMSRRGRKTEKSARKISKVLGIDFRTFCKVEKGEKEIA